MPPCFRYRCPHSCNDYYWDWHFRCARCIAWQGLLDLFAALVLVGIFIVAAAHIR